LYWSFPLYHRLINVLVCTSMVARHRHPRVLPCIVMYYRVLQYMYCHTNVYTPKKRRIHENMYCQILPCIAIYYLVLEHIYYHTNLDTPEKPRIHEVMYWHAFPDITLSGKFVQLPSYCMYETNGIHHCVKRLFLGRYTNFSLITSMPSWDKKRVFTNMSIPMF
jgi:hypothetical protein